MREQGIDIRGNIIPDGALHRAHVEGDKSRTETAWYILHADEHPNGTFGCWKRYGRNKFSWSDKSVTEEWTPEQRRQWQEKIERQRLEREQAEAERHDRAAERAQAIWDASEPADDNHPYLRRKGCKAHGIRVGRWDICNSQTGEITTVSKLALLIPIRDTRKKIWSLQAIFPSTNNVLHRDKDYLKDGAKLGFFYAFGQPINDTILVCEGYATGASLHEATGHAVVVAFDSSNLEATASALRQRFPAFRIVLCADNDQWTTAPIANPGVHFAEAAATVMGGLVAIPNFDNSVYGDSKPTDFNDLAKLEGLQAVKVTIEAALAPKIDEELPPWEGPLVEAGPAPTPIEGEVMPKEGGSNQAPPPDDDDDDEEKRIDLSLRNNPFFEVLGFEHGRYFFFHKIKRQIMEYSRGEFGESTFVELADPAIFWQQHFKHGAKKGSFNKMAATNFLMRAAEDKGIYDPDRIRGRGAWFDRERIVFHHGNYLTVDGVEREIGSFDTHYVYEMQRQLPAPAENALSDEDGDTLLELAASFRWTKPASAALLCGWIMLAPVCGALRWRPHIWLSGGAGSGKSTLLNEFVHPLLNGCDLFAQGNTTEAGLRQKLRTDALPILFEESESNEEKDRMRIQHVLSLIRQSSTESHARVYKGTMAGQSMEFLIRSMFCLASIQVGIKHQADVERVTILALRPKKEANRDGMKEWAVLENRLHEIITRDPDIGARLVRRSMNMVRMIRENINVFSIEAGKIFGSAREGDQYGTLLAGNWSLFNSVVATPYEAKTMINSYSWEEHRDTAETDESEQALAALMGARIRAPKGLEFSVFEIAAAATGRPTEGAQLDKMDAEPLLKRYGMLVKDNYLLLSNSSQELRNMMANTNFAADWRGVLLRIPGADRNDNRVAKFHGVSSKCIRIPLEPLLRQTDEAVQQSWLQAESPVEK
jgi:putative DNA primase/helicase